ncbi:hypothetical protein MRX96_014087 [Rhipicephalus microplus]
MRAFWIFGVALLIQTLTHVKTQRYSDLEDFHHYARPVRQHVSLLGGIRPSRSSLVSARCVNPRLYFRNGLTRLRFRGRVVKYICRPGYTLIGDSVSTCNAGRWDRPVPICAAPGCRLPTRDLLPRGTVENVRGRGLMLRFRCRLGYTLRGGATAFCDGRAWNGSRPVCLPSISDPDPSCDFEALDQCGWSSDLSSGVQFSRQHDHEDDDVEPADNVTSIAVASGSSPSGHYMALESLGHRLALQDLNLPAQLVSPPYRPLRFRACFRFWYRLSCNLCTLQLLLWNSTNQTPLWSSYGPRKGGWANVELPETTEYFQLVFAARTRQLEPPPATTTLLPDDVTTELDSGDTWDTTPYSSLPAVDKEGGTESSSDNASSSSTSIDNVAVTHGPEQRSSEYLKPVTTKNESDVQPRKPLSDSGPHDKPSDIASDARGRGSWRVITHHVHTFFADQEQYELKLFAKNRIDYRSDSYDGASRHQQFAKAVNGKRNFPDSYGHRKSWVRGKYVKNHFRRSLEHCSANTGEATSDDGRLASSYKLA